MPSMELRCTTRHSEMRPSVMRPSAFLLAVALASAQMMGEYGMIKKPKPAPLTEDLKYIRCETCTKMVHEAVKRAAAMSTQSAVEDMLEKICDADADGKEGRGDEGLWMSELDVSKQGQKLVLSHIGPGNCRRECRTIAKACDQVMEKVDADELVELLREKKSAGTTAQRVCTKMANVCKKGKEPVWPEGKVRKNEIFSPRMNTKDDELEKLLAGMPAMPGMTMMKGSDLDLGDGTVDEIDQLKDEV